MGLMGCIFKMDPVSDNTFIEILYASGKIIDMWYEHNGGCNIQKVFNKHGIDYKLGVAKGNIINGYLVTYKDIVIDNKNICMKTGEHTHTSVWNVPQGYLCEPKGAWHKVLRVQSGEFLKAYSKAMAEYKTFIQDQKQSDKKRHEEKYKADLELKKKQLTDYYRGK